jgi:hypothetical protein
MVNHVWKLNDLDLITDIGAVTDYIAKLKM